MVFSNKCRLSHYLFGVSKSTVCVITKDVRTAISNLLTKYIRTPCGDNLKDVVDEFEHRWGFPVDGTHIPIMSPEECHLITTIAKAGTQCLCKVL